jgi:hypothetical protein
MNDKVKLLGILGGVSVLTISVIYLFSKLSSKPKKIESSFKNKLINLANEEFKAWNKNGKIKEGNPSILPRLRKYWEEGSGIIRDDNYYINQAWSAAFISYLMRKSGAGNDFKYSQSHSQYIAEAVKNKKENNSKKFKAYKPNEVKVEVGDLVCYPRQSGVSYDSKAGYLSHCDLITSIKGNTAVGIGGNISDSVSKDNYLLKEGKIDKSKDTKNYGGIFVVIKNKK